MFLAGPFLSAGMKTSPLSHLSLLPLAGALYSLAVGMTMAGEALRVMEDSETPLSHLSLLPLAGALYLLVAGMTMAGEALYLQVAGMTMAGEALRVMEGSETPF